MLHLKTGLIQGFNKSSKNIKATFSCPPDAQQEPPHDDSADVKHPPGFRQTAAPETHNKKQQQQNFSL